MKTREERKEYLKTWQKNNRKRLAVLRRRWHENNREKVIAGRMKWLIQNPEKDAKRRREYRLKNKEKYAIQQRERLAKYKRMIVDAYGGCCSCCGEQEIEFLTVEHTNRDGKTHRLVKGNFYSYLVRSGFPKDQGLAILCMNCNWAERNGIRCPHKRTVLKVLGL